MLVQEERREEKRREEKRREEKRRERERRMRWTVTASVLCVVLCVVCAAPSRYDRGVVEGDTYVCGDPINCCMMAIRCLRLLLQASDVPGSSNATYHDRYLGTIPLSSITLPLVSHFSLSLSLSLSSLSLSLSSLSLPFRRGNLLRRSAEWAAHLRVVFGVDRLPLSPLLSRLHALCWLIPHSRRPRYTHPLYLPPSLTLSHIHTSIYTIHFWSLLPSFHLSCFAVSPLTRLTYPVLRRLSALPAVCPRDGLTRSVLQSAAVC